jgi:osmotically-inducible protein OsmY
MHDPIKEPLMKNLITRTFAFSIVLVLVLVVPASIAQAPDNTKKNKGNAITAEQQGKSKDDLDMTKNVRKAIMDDKSLSTYAHNVKVITNNGVVTLKGPVRSADEKAAIAAKAADVAGAANVKNRITVAPKKP